MTTLTTTRAIVTTGTEGSDGDVSLCYTVNGSETCDNLSNSHNDFESGQTDTFDLSLSPRLASGTKLTNIHLKYATGLSIGDSWEPTGLRVSLFYGGGEEELVCKSTFDQTVHDGDVVTPPGCP